MNKSYSKLRHIQEVNQKLENSIDDVLNTLYGEYYDHLEHIMYPKKNED